MSRRMNQEMNRKIRNSQLPLANPDAAALKKRYKDSRIEYKTLKLFGELAKAVSPPPVLTVSQWADRYRKLSAESAAEPGQWNTDRAPYQREIMDSVNDPLVEEIVIMSSAQVGKTELLLNIIGYYIDYDPAGGAAERKADGRGLFQGSSGDDDPRYTSAVWESPRCEVKIIWEYDPAQGISGRTCYDRRC